MSNAPAAAPVAAATDASDVHSVPARSATPGWTLVDAVVLVLLAALALLPRTINLLGMDPFVDEAATLDWALRLYELA